jgi:hypothetical protein
LAALGGLAHFWKSESPDRKMNGGIEHCLICGRELVPGKSVNEHHLVPKTYKGRETITIHIICHTKIHSVFSEKELNDYYHTPERLREHPEMAKFIKWVRKKEPEFRDRNEPVGGRKRRR